MAVLLVVLALPSDRAYAAVQVQQLSPSHGAPQPVGTTVTWTASATDTNPGTLEYRFTVQSPDGDFHVIRDFAPAATFAWTPSEREGTYNVKVEVKNTTSLETAQLATAYSVSSRVTGSSPVVSQTANPLVALYSAPACAAGSMRVRFWRPGDLSSQVTQWKSCLPGVSRNFYVAGMLASTQYNLQHEVSSDPSAPVTQGPTLSFTTGVPAAGYYPAKTVVTPPADDSPQPLLLHSHLQSGTPEPPRFTATDLNGGLLWYYDQTILHATSPCEGGTMFVITSTPDRFQSTLRKIDLAGSAVRETTVHALSAQLNAMGEDSITHFHHDARCMPGGKTVVITNVERTLSDVQGPGPVTIMGDMLIVLDQDWNVEWVWNGFDHLDVTRKAIFDNKYGPPFAVTAPQVNNWTHSNSVTYSPADGNFILSMRHQDWVIKIDYSDGQGTGDVVWRLGKDGDFKIDSDDPYPWFSHQHDAEYEPGSADTLTIYDNGNTRQVFPNLTLNSRGQVYKLDETNLTATLLLNADLGGYANAWGSAQKLADGNYHFMSGRHSGNVGRSIEVSPAGVLGYTLQSQPSTYRSYRMRNLYTLGDSTSDNGDAQSITFDDPADKTFGDAPFNVTATASSGLPVTVRVASGPATITGNTVTINGAGTVVLQADQHGNIKYDRARSVRQSFAVAKAGQTITFGVLPDKTFGDAPFNVTATGGASGNPVTFSASGGCASGGTNGAVITITGAGSCTVTASQAGNSNFNAAPDVQRTFNVNKAGQTITFGTLSDKTFGDPDFTVSATASSGLEVSFAAAGTCTVTGSTVHITGAGPCTIIALQVGDANYNAAVVLRPFTIGKAAATITLGNLSQTFDGSPKVATATTIPAGKTVILSYSQNTQPVASPTAAGGYGVTAVIDDANYQGGTTGTLTINKAGSTTTVTAPDAVYDGSPHGGTATATGAGGLSQSLPVTYTGRGETYGPSPTPPTNAGLYRASASYAGDANHDESSGSRDFQIAKAGQTITFGALPDRTFGDAPFNVTATGGASGNPVTFSASGGCASGGTNGAVITITGAGSCTVTASQAGNSNFNAAANVSQSFGIAKANTTTTVTVGNAAYDGQPHGGTASVTGPAGLNQTLTVSYVGRNGTNYAQSTTAPTNAGDYTASASYAGDSNYNTSSDTKNYSITKAGQTITFGALPNKTFGDADFPVSATASSGLPVVFSASGNCTILGGQVHIEGAGSCTVTAKQPGGDNYSAAPDVSRTFDINKAGQTITFGVLPDKTFGDAPFNVTATGGASGNPVTFSSQTATVCSVSGSTVTILSGGACTVRASQAGNGNYADAANVDRTFQVVKAATSTAVTSSPNPAGVGQGVAYVATVTSANVRPNGVVRFFAGGSPYGPSGVPCEPGAGNTCTAELRADPLAAGTHAITAEYLGNDNFLGSTGTLPGGQTIVAGGVFEFAQAAYAVAERGGFVTVRVLRQGDASLPASVDYLTDDGGVPSVFVPCAATTGIASERCDFTRAAGTLRFAAGVREQTFTVLVGDDTYAEGPETLSLKLSNPTGGAALASTHTATLEITDNVPESAGNAVDDTANFVREHYHGFLNREPDAPGLAFWTQEIEQCGANAQCREAKRVHVSAAFFLAIEFQETGYLAYRTYKAAYGDATNVIPAAGGGTEIISVPVVRLHEFLPDTRVIGDGVVVNSAGWEQRLEANKQAYMLEFVRRERFLSAFPTSMTAAQFVDKLFLNAGVTPTAAERSAAVAAYGSGDAAGRAAALRLAAENQTLQQAEFRRAFVLMQFYGYLRRNPDDPQDVDFRGWKFWLDKLNQFNGNFIEAEMVRGFLSSIEYRKRFGQ